MPRLLDITALLLIFVTAPVAGQTSATIQTQPATNAATRTLIVAVKPAPPFVVHAKDGGYSGISVELWERIADSLGLKYEYRETDLDALVDDMAQGRADVGVGALTVTAEREARFDFSQPFYTSGLGIAVAVDESPGWWLVVKKLFSTEFLSAILALSAVLLLSGFLVWLFEHKRNPEQFGGAASKGIGAGFWWAAVTMTTVGYGDASPKTLGGRLVGIVWMFTAVIVISSFTASIASSLTVGQLSAKVSGPDDLPSVRVGTLPDSTSSAYLDKANVGYQTFETIPAALDALDSGQIDAMVYDAPLLKYSVGQRAESALTVLPNIFERQKYAFALPEGSPLQEQINRALLELTDKPAWNDTLSRYLGGNRG